MTPLELVKEYFPTASDEIAGDVLWHCTGWPSFFVDDEPVEQQLRKQLSSASVKSNADPLLAMAIVDEEAEESLKKLDGIESTKDKQ